MKLVKGGRTDNNHKGWVMTHQKVIKKYWPCENFLRVSSASSLATWGETPLLMNLAKMLAYSLALFNIVYWASLAHWVSKAACRSAKLTMCSSSDSACSVNCNSRSFQALSWSFNVDAGEGASLLASRSVMRVIQLIESTMWLVIKVWCAADFWFSASNRAHYWQFGRLLDIRPPIWFPVEGSEWSKVDLSKAWLWSDSLWFMVVLNWENSTDSKGVPICCLEAGGSAPPKPGDCRSGGGNLLLQVSKEGSKMLLGQSGDWMQVNREGKGASMLPTGKTLSSTTGGTTSIAQGCWACIQEWGRIWNPVRSLSRGGLVLLVMLAGWAKGLSLNVNCTS